MVGGRTRWKGCNVWLCEGGTTPFVQFTCMEWNDIICSCLYEKERNHPPFSHVKGYKSFVLLTNVRRSETILHFRM